MYRKISLYFAAGAAGGIAYMFFLWGFGALGITQFLNVDLVYKLTPELFYTCLGMGGIGGFLFFIPVFSKNRLQRGLITGLIAAAIALFVLMPMDAERGITGFVRAFSGETGMLGLHKGAMAPVLIIIFNCVWGITASLWLGLSEKRI